MRGDEPAEGPAFGEVHGVSVRLWLAAQAMRGMLANPNNYHSRWFETVRIVSRQSFEIADAMLKQSEATR